MTGCGNVAVSVISVPSPTFGELQNGNGEGAGETDNVTGNVPGRSGGAGFAAAGDSAVRADDTRTNRAIGIAS